MLSNKAIHVELMLSNKAIYVERWSRSRYEAELSVSVVSFVSSSMG